MAKPDLDNGYVKIAHELLAALACAGFTRWEWVVLREVLDQIYGVHKLTMARLSPTDIAARAGTYKESITRAIRGLLAAGVLVRDGLDGYRFIKDYDRWRRDGVPRLSATEAAYCVAAQRINKSNAQGNNGAHASTERGNNGAHASTERGNNGAHASTERGNNGAPLGERRRSHIDGDGERRRSRIDVSSCSPPAPPIGEAPARSGKKGIEGEGCEKTRTHTHTREDPGMTYRFAWQNPAIRAWAGLDEYEGKAPRRPTDERRP